MQTIVPRCRQNVKRLARPAYIVSDRDADLFDLQCRIAAAVGRLLIEAQALFPLEFAGITRRALGPNYTRITDFSLAAADDELRTDLVRGGRR